jgi:hypothetical protein
MSMDCLLEHVHDLGQERKPAVNKGRGHEYQNLENLQLCVEGLISNNYVLTLTTNSHLPL